MGIITWIVNIIARAARRPAWLTATGPAGLLAAARILAGQNGYRAARR
jgi:hypothetical protein